MPILSPNTTNVFLSPAATNCILCTLSANRLWVHNFWQLALLPGFIHIANGDFRGGDFLNFGLDQRWEQVSRGKSTEGKTTAGNTGDALPSAIRYAFR